MAGLVCLQGGAEFGPACRTVDQELLARVTGSVVVSALAGSVGRDYATASANGVRHYASLGARAAAAPDARTDLDGWLRAVEGCGLLVLPGGSPTRLRAALVGLVAEAVSAVLDRGGAVMGASAGAMLLSGWTVLPDTAGMPVVEALGIVAGCAVLPHWSGGRADWVAALRRSAPQAVLLGLPEATGLLVGDGVATVSGVAPVTVIDAGTPNELPPGATIPWPDDR